MKLLRFMGVKQDFSFFKRKTTRISASGTFPLFQLVLQFIGIVENKPNVI